jgi:succinate dehydrogenase/fumarate reductase flavoprotein subunit
MTRKFIIYFFCRGNSAKASSGMNGVPTASQHMHGISDSKLQFMEDTITSGGSLADRHLVARLVEDSASAIDWIEQQGVPLRVVSQCGGHSCPRTHRIAPDENGRATPVGWGIMSALQRKIQEANINVLFSSPVRKLITVNGRVTGVRLGNDQVIQTDAVVLTTGGFAGKTVHGDNAVLHEFAPKVDRLATTNGPWATGDGIRLGQDIGASLRDMVCFIFLRQRART